MKGVATIVVAKVAAIVAAKVAAKEQKWQEFPVFNIDCEH